MRLSYDELSTHLKQSLAPIYVVSSDEPDLLIEAQKRIVKAATVNAFGEKQIFHAHNTAEWQNVWQSILTPSLFSAKQCLIIHTAAKSLTAALQQRWVDYCNNINTNNCIIITLTALKANQFNQPWLKAIERLGAIVTIRKLNAGQFKPYVNRQIERYGMRITPSALHALCDQLQENTQLASQVTESLYCLYGINRDANAPAICLDESHLTAIAIGPLHIDVFRLIDACLLGEIPRITQFCQVLKAQGAEAILINWAISRAVRQLLYLLTTTDNFQVACTTQGIWPKQQHLFREATKRLSKAACLQLLQACQYNDTCIKGLGETDIWLELEKTCMAFVNPTILNLKLC